MSNDPDFFECIEDWNTLTKEKSLHRQSVLLSS